MKRLLPLLVAFLSISLLTACGAATPSPTPSSPTPPMSSFHQTEPPAADEEFAVIETSKGTIKFRFFPEFAPETVKNFKELAKKGFYDGLIFHRVIPDFMIQGGDPSGNGTGGESYKGPGTTLKAEISPFLKHYYGALSMARKGGDLNSATSQFFIVQNHKGTDFLNDQYTVFGQTFEGLEVIDAIVNVDRDANDKPLKKVIMKKVTIENFKP